MRQSLQSPMKPLLNKIIRLSLPTILSFASVPQAQLLIPKILNAFAHIRMPFILDFNASAHQAIFNKGKPAYHALIHVLNA